jgi:hypothetical protein
MALPFSVYELTFPDLAILHEMLVQAPVDQ